MRKATDEIGKIYKGLVVVARDTTKTNRAFWICKCPQCNHTYSISGTHLRKGDHAACTYCNDIHKNAFDETGKRYGHFIVLEPDISKDRHLYWKCKCDCGNVESIKGTFLRDGSRTQCLQCSKKPQYIDETGNKYGKLTVLKYDKESGKNAS